MIKIDYLKVGNVLMKNELKNSLAKDKINYQYKLLLINLIHQQDKLILLNKIIMLHLIILQHILVNWLLELQVFK